MHRGCECQPRRNCVAGLLMVLACRSSMAHADDWPTYQHDLQHTGYYQNPVTADVPGSLAAGATMPLSIAPNPSRGSIRMTYGLRKATNLTIEVFSERIK